MGLRKKKSLIDQASDYVETVRPSSSPPSTPPVEAAKDAARRPALPRRTAARWPTPPRREAAPELRRRRPRQGAPYSRTPARTRRPRQGAGRRPRKAAPPWPTPRKAAPAIAAGAAVAAEKTSTGARLAAEKAAPGRDLAAARSPELKGEPEPKKGSKLKKLRADRRPRRRARLRRHASCRASRRRQLAVLLRPRRPRRRATSSTPTPPAPAPTRGPGRRRRRSSPDEALADAGRGAPRGHHPRRPGRRRRDRRRPGRSTTPEVPQPSSPARHRSRPEDRSSGRFSSDPVVDPLPPAEEPVDPLLAAVGDLRARHLPPAHDDPLVHRQLAPHVADGEHVVEARCARRARRRRRARRPAPRAARPARGASTLVIASARRAIRSSPSLRSRSIARWRRCGGEVAALREDHEGVVLVEPGGQRARSAASRSSPARRGRAR